MLCRLAEELDSQQVVSDQHTHRLASVMSALDELQERREVSDSGRGRLRGLLSAPLEQFAGVLGGSAGGLPPRGSGLIRQSSRLSGAVAYSSSSQGVRRTSRRKEGTMQVSETSENHAVHTSSLYASLQRGGGRLVG